MLEDTLHRPLEELRVSVTDRCNLRCRYCMPLDQYQWLDKPEILRFEEIERLVRIFVAAGIHEVRLTGGEPLLRRDLPNLVRRIRGIPGIEQCTLTTNAILLDQLAEPLVSAGITRFNLSLDTLRRDRFIAIAQRDELDRTLHGIEAALKTPLRPIKLNAVVMRGLNDDEIVPLLRFCRDRGLALRLIEYMDVGNSNGWTIDKVFSRREMIEVLEKELGPVQASRDRHSDPTERLRFADPGIDVGVIASVTQPFCGNCSRARLTADGQLVTCLFATRGTDLKHLLRNGADDAQILERIRSTWQRRTDRYSEERTLATTGATEPRAPKIEMIRLGG